MSKKEMKYISVGEGTCPEPLATTCSQSECDLCMFNTAGTTRDFYDGELNSLEFEPES